MAVFHSSQWKLIKIFCIRCLMAWGISEKGGFMEVRAGCRQAVCTVFYISSAVTVES